jgi:hypothetical protein
MHPVAIPEEIAIAVHSWARDADAEQLNDGPAIANLGGVAAVANAAASLAVSPWLPYLVDVAGKAYPPAHADPDPNADADLIRIDMAVVTGFATHDRPSAYASAVSRLLRYPGLAARLDRQLERALLARAEHAAQPDASPRVVAIGGSALEALVHLSTTRVCKPHRLLAFCGDLVETAAAAPAELKRRMPRLVGILHEHFAEADLLSLLRQLAGDPAADNDATFEIALADLRTALSAPDFPAIIDGLMQARRGFAAVTDAEEQRHDADAYAAAIDAIVGFNRGDVIPVQNAAARLDAAVTHHTAWLAGYYSPPWMTNRRQEERAWQRLSVFLAAAATPVGDDAWYRVDEAIAALLDAYRESRSFTSHVDDATGPNQGVEQLIRPVIEATFVDNARNLSLLDQALANDDRFRRDEVAQQLSTAVHAAVAAAHATAIVPPGGERLGKDLRRLPATLRYFRVERAEELVDALPEHLQRELEAVLYDARVARSESGNPKVDAMLDDLRQGLATSPDWPLAGGPFQVLVEQTVLFLMRCYNIGSSTGGSRTAYLHTTPEGEAPKERLLQSDYLDWLKDGPFYATVRAEVPDVAAGRADVVIELGGISFYVECKREEKDASHDGLHKYVGQARAYSVTNVAFGILLVLDLTRHPTGVPDLFSSVWTEHVQVSPEETPRHIVVVRVPGNRPVPHATRSPARTS